jgi:hypothetical protein
MPMTDPTARPALQLLPIVQLLDASGVNWVLTGSTVLAIYGARLIPNDLDVTPDLHPDNLQRLAVVLRNIDAIPAFTPQWPDGPSMTDCGAWTPYPATEQNLDHLFVTRLGMLDVPPRICGTYDDLIKHAARVDVGGIPIAVCALSEVLTRLHGRTRAKDQQRAAIYRQMASYPTDQLAPVGVPWLLSELNERAN